MFSSERGGNRKRRFPHTATRDHTKRSTSPNRSQADTSLAIPQATASAVPCQVLEYFDHRKPCDSEHQFPVRSALVGQVRTARKQNSPIDDQGLAVIAAVLPAPAAEVHLGPGLVQRTHTRCLLLRDTAGKLLPIKIRHRAFRHVLACSGSDHQRR